MPIIYLKQQFGDENFEGLGSGTLRSVACSLPGEAQRSCDFSINPNSCPVYIVFSRFSGATCPLVSAPCYINRRHDIPVLLVVFAVVSRHSATWPPGPQFGFYCRSYLIDPHPQIILDPKACPPKPIVFRMAPGNSSGRCSAKGDDRGD